MKYSEQWLREWVDPTITCETLCHDLTMAGFEVNELAPVAEPFTGVVVAQVLQVEKHPAASRLSQCIVDVGQDKMLHIVCGATNVKAGMKTAAALMGAVLPHQLTIASTSIRGVISQGMLCSAEELGLSPDGQGILAFDDDAPIGQNVWDYLQLADQVWDVAITPNRGDCLSLRGLAREVAAITKTPLKDPLLYKTFSLSAMTLPVTIQAQSACPRYVGRVIRQVKRAASTPIWLKERLRRSGVRSISPIVDVTNYVMLELGQPMHAFDLGKIQKGIMVRYAQRGEQIDLLDGSRKELNTDTLVVADHERPLAIAGIMGGVDSSVTSDTTDIFLESAYFSAPVIAKQRSYYDGLSSESAYRFERGVDPTIQQLAIERATQLILQVVEGEAGPCIESVYLNDLPPRLTIPLSFDQVSQVLGIMITAYDIEAILSSLGFSYEYVREQLMVTVPSHRFDITVPEDLIEEVARLYGYDRIPATPIKQALPLYSNSRQVHLNRIRCALSDQGYHEVITYSFISKKMQALFDPDHQPRVLLNPITTDMAVMRTHLWPGLINVLLYNRNHQQRRIRLFEIGTCFNISSERQQLAGLATGGALPEQWGMTGCEMDFYDVKGDLENVLSLLYRRTEITFQWASHPALHPGQTAAICDEGKQIGLVGALHPAILHGLDLEEKIFAFEVDLNALKSSSLPRLTEISKFPEIRRDIAIILDEAIPVKEIQDTIKYDAPDWFKEVFVFDIYQGSGVEYGMKSVALALILQHADRTLVDEEVVALMERITATLKSKFGAELRS